MVYTKYFSGVVKVKASVSHPDPSHAARVSLVWWSLINPLTASAAYIRVFIFY